MIARWARGEVHGEIHSPFDLVTVEIEEAPRGTVTLQGFRGNASQEWRLGQDDWRIQATPNFSDAGAASYRQGKELAAAGKVAAAAEKWRTLADQPARTAPPWLRTWLLSHLAQALAEAGDWAECDRAYQQMLQPPANQAEFTAHIQRSWGMTFMRRNDWPNAESHFRQALSVEQAAGKERLALSITLDDLGVLARKQGHLAEAEAWYSQALHLRERLAPDSLAVASSLNHLGQLANDAGRLDQDEEFAQRAFALAEKAAPGSASLADALENFGDVAFDRGKLPLAKDYYARSFAIRNELEAGSLDVAKALNGLGWVAWQTGDLERAQQYHRGALAIREKLAPGGLEVAQSLANLGTLARMRGDLVQTENYYFQVLEVRERLAPGSLALASILNNIGNVASDRGDLAKAEDYYRRSLAIKEKLTPGSLDVAAGLNNLGNIALYRGDLVKAEDYYHQSLEIKEKLAPGSLGVANGLTNLGNIALYRGDLVKAEDYYHQSLEIREKLAPGSLVVANGLASLGNAALNQGDLAKAEGFYRRNLEVTEKQAPGSLDVAASFNNLAVFAEAQGDLAAADKYLRHGLAIQERAAPGSLEVARAFANLGDVAWHRGDMAKAGEYQERALAIREKQAPGSLDVAASLNTLGLIAWKQGELAKAADFHHRARAIREKLAPGSLDHAQSLNNLGVVERERGDVAEAEALYRQALDIRERLAPISVDVAWNLNRLAEVVEARGDLEQAEQCYLKALAIWEKIAPGNGNAADSSAGLASIRRRQGRNQEAARFYEQALNAVEVQTARLGGAADVRADFRAVHENYYREYIDLLVFEGKPEIAFQVLERSRARTLLETLAAAQVDIRNGVDPELIKKEHSLQADINAKSERRVRFLSEKQSNELIHALEKEIRILTSEYQDVEAQIRSSSPAYAALTQPRLLDAAEIQQQLLDRNTLLVEYSLGEERSYVFVVSSAALQTLELPKRTVIEAASRRVYELLTARNRRGKRERPAEWAARIAQADADYPRAVARLSQMVLGPIARKLAGKRLLIVSDGALRYIPFAALTVPAYAAPQQPLPLVARHEIVNLPSASVLAVLRRERMGRQPAAKTVAVLADPVFDREDARVKPDGARLMRSSDAGRGVSGVQTVETAQNNGVSQKDVAAATSQESAEPEESLESNQLTRSAADVGWQRSSRGEVYLPRLQSTRKEAEAIVAITPANQSLEVLDFKANRATATSAVLANYRIVHFATHALLNSKHPELSGLVLSLVDEVGRPQSGFLGLEDIYNLNLPVELVVLSACETALGKGVEGEGMVGLTRGFMYAGATRVMASLWNIDDRATADQMRYFYRAMIGQGMRPAAALRAAQLKMREDPRWSSPYFWAAFQIQGEWK